MNFVTFTTMPPKRNSTPNHSTICRIKNAPAKSQGVPRREQKQPTFSWLMILSPAGSGGFQSSQLIIVLEQKVDEMCEHESDEAEFCLFGLF